jgi:hypothetical protein
MSGKKNRGGRADGPSTPQAGSGKGKSEQDTPTRVQQMLTRGTRCVEVFRQPRPPGVLQKERDDAQVEAR